MKLVFNLFMHLLIILWSLCSAIHASTDYFIKLAFNLFMYLLTNYEACAQLIHVFIN